MAAILLRVRNVYWLRIYLILTILELYQKYLTCCCSYSFIIVALAQALFTLAPDSRGSIVLFSDRQSILCTSDLRQRSQTLISNVIQALTTILTQIMPVIHNAFVLNAPYKVTRERLVAAQFLAVIRQRRMRKELGWEGKICFTQRLFSSRNSPFFNTGSRTNLRRSSPCLVRLSGMKVTFAWGEAGNAISVNF